MKFLQSIILFLFIFLLKTTISLAGPVIEQAPVQHPLEAQSKTIDLQEAYQLALKRSELIAIQAQIIKEAEGRFYQALSGVLPDISFVISEEREYGHGFADRTRGQRFRFSQPLFSGFKEFAAIAASRAERRGRLAEKRRAEELLFTDVSDAFYFYLSYQDQEETYAATHQALEDRIKELTRRQDLGRSRPSEVASAQAQLSRLEADLQSVLSNKETAHQLLEFLIGTTFQNVIDKEEKLSVRDLTYYLNKASNRSDVKAAYEAWRVAQKQITIAGSGFLPAISADGNYYTKRQEDSDVDWDTTIAVEVPIFKGFSNVGLVKEARSIAAQQKLLYERKEREASLDVENSYTRLEKTILREEALRKALEASEKNYKLQVEDYQKSLVSNLTVLQALEDLQDSRQDYAVAKRETKRLYWSLKVATGELE